MTRKAYPSDINNAEWEIIEPLLPTSQPIGRPREVNLREIMNGIFVSSASEVYMVCIAT